MQVSKRESAFLYLSAAVASLALQMPLLLRQRKLSVNERDMEHREKKDGRRRGKRGEPRDCGGASRCLP